MLPFLFENLCLLKTFLALWMCSKQAGLKLQLDRTRAISMILGPYILAGSGHHGILRFHCSSAGKQVSLFIFNEFVAQSDKTIRNNTHQSHFPEQLLIASFCLMWPHPFSESSIPKLKLQNYHHVLNVWVILPTVTAWSCLWGSHLQRKSQLKFR